MRAYGSGAAPEHVGAVGDGAATALGQPGENRIRRRYPFTNDGVLLARPSFLLYAERHQAVLANRNRFRRSPEPPAEHLEGGDVSRALADREILLRCPSAPAH